LIIQLIYLDFLNTNIKVPINVRDTELEKRKCDRELSQVFCMIYSFFNQFIFCFERNFFKGILNYYGNIGQTQYTILEQKKTFIANNSFLLI
jgi:hypothetical protein